MPDVGIVFDIVRFLAPGLLFMLVLYRSGVIPRGSDSEWVVWSIIFSLPIRWVGTKLVTLLGLETNPGLIFEMYLMAVALAGGLVIIAIRSLFSIGEGAAED
jgi:hypothetical protein